MEPGEDYSGIVDLYANECVGELGRQPPWDLESDVVVVVASISMSPTWFS